MRDILFLVHRIPYPPNKGDKIRSFHLLQHLAASHRVRLGAFVDDPDDWRHRPELERYCAEVCLLPLNPTLAKLKSLWGLLSGEPLTVPYYRDRRMAAWVDGLCAGGKVDGVLVFSSAMAQYVEAYDSLPRIVDFCDVDSDKWRQYAARKSWPMSWLYRREAERLLDFDRRIARGFDHALFVSAPEAELFAGLAPESAGRVAALENGVDTGYFDPAGDYPNPYPPGAEALVFTGAMDYWANIDAVTWFAGAVWPELRRRRPSAVFYIVGARPAEAVRALARQEGIVVTGTVADVRPYLKHARLAVAPLRIARGIQNKVLEAMAMAKPVLASAAALEGIAAEPSLDAWTVDAAPDWCETALARLDRDPRGDAPHNREFVRRRYGWQASLGRLDALWRSP